MTTPFPSPTAPEPLRFTVAGTVATWEPIGRWLRIADYHLSVVSGVSVFHLIPGAHVTVWGYQDSLTTRWIVTALRRD